MLKIHNITSTSGSFEIVNNNCYYSGENYELYLNNEFVREESCNSFSLSNLKSDTNYDLKLTKENKVVYYTTFKTEIENVVFNVKKFGAVGDGIKDDTLAIQTAIMACPAKGRIYFPKGIYSVNSIFLKSNITLEISQDAKIQGSGKIENYSVLPGIIDGKDGKEYNFGSWEGNPLDTYAGIITAIDVENVKIIGQGTIDGGGNFETWWKDPKKKKPLAWRPRTIFLCRSKNIVLEGIKIQNSPSWTVHPYFSENLKFLNLRVENPAHSPNTDGIDPESCKNVLILGVKFSVGDDCIAIKAGKIYMGKKYKVPTENVEIRNSLMQFGHGSVVIGSEMAGGVKNVMIEKCIFFQTDRGIRMKTRRGRGEDAIIDNIYADNIKMIDVVTPFTINPFYFCDPDGKTEYVYTREKLEVDFRTPLIKNIIYKNIDIKGMELAAGYIAGLPEMPIENLTLENITIEATEKENYEAEDVEMFLFAPKAKKRGFIFENIKNLKLENITFKGIEGDEYEIK